VATRFTRATVARALLRPVLRLTVFRTARLARLRVAALRPPLRRADFRAVRADFRTARATLRALDRFRTPPRFRPDELFLPPERLDLLAAAMDKLRVAGFVRRIARFAHNACQRHRV